ncbi:hypothetical protein ACN4EK_06310 [Pantanalinema rosaneae CENA516]|uniref:hypothetical protein n=1 Tax=Pantanalinema rosaneae TaxID=1620701 RepID=UPI003D7017BF
MQATAALTEVQWQVADAIAQSLVRDGTDVNEFKKIISYLRAYRERDNAGTKFFDYLKTLAKNGGRIGHSNKTSAYLNNIERTCVKYLQPYQNDAVTMLQILGWAARLVQYYDKAGPIGEIPEIVVPTEREAVIQAVTQANQFEIGQRLEATIAAIKGNKVTYEILGTIRLTEKEPRKASTLSESQPVTIEILDLKEDGSIRKVKCID